MNMGGVIENSVITVGQAKRAESAVQALSNLHMAPVDLAAAVSVRNASSAPDAVDAGINAAKAALALIDANDAVYSQLRMWKDANQDGVSQTGELHTLADLGIARIGVAGTASNVNLGNGNTQPLSGSFTRTNGTTGVSGVAEVTGSLLLASNNFYREFTDDPGSDSGSRCLAPDGWQRLGAGSARGHELGRRSRAVHADLLSKKSATGNRYAGMRGISCKRPKTALGAEKIRAPC